MRKSDLLARFCVYRGLATDEREAHTDLLLLFSEEYPIASFEKWDTALDQEWAERFYLRYRDDPDCDLKWLMTGLGQVN